MPPPPWKIHGPMPLLVKEVVVHREKREQIKKKPTRDVVPSNHSGLLYPAATALDSEQWTGHSGCVILAPHLVTLRKKDVGLPHASEASERQKRDGMCWEKEDELYNNGSAFKITCRDKRGVIVTLIADNYFGYCKKEVKTQISYAANLLGNAEEEHAGGAIAYPCFDHGEHFGGLAVDAGADEVAAADLRGTFFNIG